ncbi:unnamed protein product [Penicillium viridicatum]
MTSAHSRKSTVNFIEAIMSAAATLKSPNVCANCKARNKRCDSLCRAVATAMSTMLLLLQPRIGVPVDPQPSLAMIYPVYSALPSAASPQSQSGVWKTASTLRANNPASVSRALLLDSLACSTYIPCEAPVSTVESTLCVQAQRLLEITRPYLDEISVRYFHGVHTFVPITSRRLFHTQLLSFGANLQADFTLLVLCMALLVSSTDSINLLRPQGGHRLDDLSLYVAIKSLMAQAQALHAPTTRLVQAGVLLAVYDYAHGHPE